MNTSQKIIDAIKANGRRYYNIKGDLSIHCEVRIDTKWYIDFSQIDLKPSRIAVTKNNFNEDTILSAYQNGIRYNVVWLDKPSVEKLLSVIEK